jgi:uncharacterized protein with NRDE domain
MCLLVVGWRLDARFPLVVAANRDECHERPTRALHRWADGMVAGRDEEAGGTWLGVAPGGRFASVTNLHPPAPAPAGAPSRGQLVRDFLASDEPPESFAHALAGEAQRYAGFNLLVCDADEAYVLCSRDARATRLEPGVHGLANDPPGTPLVRVARSADRLHGWLESGDHSPEPLFAALTDRRPGEAGEVAGAPSAERSLAPPFLVHPLYGTRSSTVVLRTGSDIEVVERSWDASGALLGESRERVPARG